MDHMKVCARLLVLLTGVLLCNALQAQHAGMSVTKSGEIREDVYTAGATVQMMANIDGDAVVAGGNVTIVESVSGDVLAAGGSVTISADVADDIRAAGGSVSVGGRVGGDAVIAGGTVTLNPTSSIGERAWLAGGTLNVGGSIGKELKAAGGEIVISATVDGDAELFANSVVIQPGAVILGDLNYAAPEQAVIAEGARIEGEINWRKMEFDHQFVDAGWNAGAAVLFVVSLAISAIVFCLIYPGFTGSAVGRMRGSPLESLLFGLLALILTPIVAFILMATLIVMPLGFLLLAMYFVVLILGLLMALAFVGDIIFRAIGRDAGAAKSIRALSLVVAAALWYVVGLVPLAGGLVLFLAWLLGIGASMLRIHKRRAE